MSDSFVRCQCAKIGDMMKGDCGDTSVSRKTFAYLGCMRLAAHWTDSYPVAEFWFIWSDKLGLPEYPPVYITLGFVCPKIIISRSRTLLVTDGLSYKTLTHSKNTFLLYLTNQYITS